jgi:catechol 2,3-dioxygenase
LASEDVAGAHLHPGYEAMDQIDPSLRIGSVELGVSDLGRSVHFYTRVLGLSLTEQAGGRAVLGTGPERAALTLTQIAQPAPAADRSTGLYHVAWLHPSRAALAGTVRRIVGARWRLDGASDHGVSEALYLSDPDSLGIEIYCDRPPGRWERPAVGPGVRMYTAPLDIDDLLAQAPQEPAPEIGRETIIGHVHMKVSDVPRSLAFYRDALGFEQQAGLGEQAAFLSAGGYHHHIGLNCWESRGGAAAPDSAPGMRRLTFELGGDGAVEELRIRAGESASPGPDAGGVLVRDPDAQLLAFAAR